MPHKQNTYNILPFGKSAIKHNIFHLATLLFNCMILYNFSCKVNAT